MSGPQPLHRRHLLQASTLLLLGTGRWAQAAQVVAVRLWPARDYTRVAIESDERLQVQTVSAEGSRLTVDIEGLHLLVGLSGLVGQLQRSDPNIAALQVSPAPGDWVRLTIEVKQPVRPQVFHLQPVAPYQHRLVLDLYPLQDIDPLAQLVAQRLQERDAASERAAQLLGHEPVPAPGTALPAPPTPPAKPTHRPETHDPLGALIAQRESRRPPAETKPPSAAAASPPTSSPSPSPARAERLIIVALDPGHGGEDPGAIGPGGTPEKMVVLQIAHKLRERIHATRVNGHPMRAYMTRDADFFVPLGQRVQKARRVQADLFISIHADAFFSPQPAGASVFALSNLGATSATARWLADKENASDRVGGVNVKGHDATVQRTLLDMSTSAQIKDSLRLGDAMLREMGRVGRLHKPRVEQAGFAVLKAPDIPSVLVETAFISNPDEERRLRDDAYQNRLADALLRGIVRYFEAHPPLARNLAL